FEKFNLPKKYTKNISLNINSKIPVGKGMASSTADIGATIKATLSLIDKDLSSEEISKLAAEIEPTDSIFIDKNSIFNPLNGTVIKYLGNLTNAKVVILEPNKVLDTMKIRLRQDYNKLKVENKEVIKKSFALLEEGLKKNNLSLVGEACTLSSLANENIEKKEYLKSRYVIEQGILQKNFGLLADFP
uniref:GHMP family kinase ATP-binding protein n=1 Tax=Phocaeicola sp. TaxID=2773926 RepID=UPI002A806A04